LEKKSAQLIAKDNRRRHLQRAMHERSLPLLEFLIKVFFGNDYTLREKAGLVKKMMANRLHNNFGAK
jgi:hypothetical protein